MGAVAWATRTGAPKGAYVHVQAVHVDVRCILVLLKTCARSVRMLMLADVDVQCMPMFYVHCSRSVCCSTIGWSVLPCDVHVHVSCMLMF
jgi:hypothetical protein